METTELQKQIIDVLKDYEHLTCDEIAWRLQKHKIHIGNSVKALVKKNLLNYYRPYDGGNFKYYLM